MVIVLDVPMRINRRPAMSLELTLSGIRNLAATAIAATICAEANLTIVIKAINTAHDYPNGIAVS